MHEHLETFKLINMNGRVYDPILGRFLSPDNFVQDAGSTQAYNRYTYCLNNPLAYTDPSGWISTETMPFQWIAPTYYYSSFFQPKFGAFAGDNYAVEYFSNFHNGGSHLAGAEGAGNFRSRGLRGYTYDWNAHHAGITGVYRNSSGEQVGFAEVFTNYVVPNATRIISGDELRKSIYSVTGAMAAQLTGVGAGSSGGFHCAPTINDPTKIFLMTLKCLETIYRNVGAGAEKGYSVYTFYSASFSIRENGFETPLTIFNFPGDNWVMMSNNSPAFAPGCDFIEGKEYDVIECDYTYHANNPNEITLPAFYIVGPIRDFGGTRVFIHNGNLPSHFEGCKGFSDIGYNRDLVQLNDGSQRIIDRLYFMVRTVLGQNWMQQRDKFQMRIVYRY